MQADFWHARWANNEIGFHLKDVNSRLVEYWPSLDVPKTSRVLVPLCGKSLDMCWLLAKGHEVMGVELSPKAVAEFFSEQGLAFTTHEQGAFTHYRADGLEIFCGDFFALQASDVADCHALYDRAALIALPAEMRERYVAHLNNILPKDCRGLLLTLEYPQEQMAGPPFSVADSEVRERFATNWELDLLHCADVLQQNQRFAERGASSLCERVYRLRRI